MISTALSDVHRGFAAMGGVWSSAAGRAAAALDRVVEQIEPTGSGVLVWARSKAEDGVCQACGSRSAGPAAVATAGWLTARWSVVRVTSNPYGGSVTKWATLPLGSVPEFTRTALCKSCAYCQEPVHVPL